MRNAIGYIRVSTEEQGSDDKYGIDTQKQAIQAYASANGYGISSWCIDKISGVKDNRPEFDKILYNPPSGIDAVIVFKNDRVARDTKLYFYYFYTLEKKNIKLLSTEEHFREGDDFANIYRSLLMFVAEQERKNIALRTSKGRSLKARCGGYSGGTHLIPLSMPLARLSHRSLPQLFAPETISSHFDLRVVFISSHLLGTSLLILSHASETF